MANVNLTNVYRSTLADDVRNTPAASRDFTKPGATSALSAGQARRLLTEIRAQLTAGGKLQAGYLSLSSKGEGSMLENSRFGGSVASRRAAAELVKSLVNTAYRGQLGSDRMEQINRGLDTYLNWKSDKLGTRSFVKLVNELEVSVRGTAVQQDRASSGRLKVSQGNGAQASEAPRGDVSKDLLETLQSLQDGESVSIEKGGVLGAKLSGGAGLGVHWGEKHEKEKGVTLVRAEANVGAQALGHDRTLLKKQGEKWVLEQHKFVGAGIVAGLDADALKFLSTESEGSKSLGRLKHLEVRFDTPDAAVNFIRKGRSGVDPGSFEVVKEHKGFAVRSETEVRHTTFQRALKAKPVGGVAESGLVHHAVSVDRTVYKEHDGSTVNHRVYKDDLQKNNIGLKLLAVVTPVVTYDRNKTTSQMRLEMRHVTPVVGQGGSLRASVSPNMTLGIDSTMVQACRDPAAARELADIQYTRVLSLLETANKDAPGCFAMTDAAKASLKASVFAGFERIHERLTEVVDPRQLAQREGAAIREDGRLINQSVKVKVGLNNPVVKLDVASGSVGWTSGGQVTMKLSFAPPSAQGALQSFEAKGVELGYTSRSKWNWEASAGLNVGSATLSPVELETSAGVRVGTSREQTVFTRAEKIQINPPPSDMSAQPAGGAAS